jgi:uncharacterized membrane protein required for colicin V production
MVAALSGALLQDVATTEPVESPWSLLAPVDWIGAGLVVLFAALGAWRGLWWQAMRFAGLAAAVLIARAFTPKLAPSLHARLPDLDPRLGQGLVWLLLFLAGLAVAALLGRLGKRLLDAMQLGLVDRMGGLVAGTLTALLLHAALVAALLQLAPADVAHRAVAGTRSEVLVHTLARPLPVLFDDTTRTRVHELLAAPPTAVPPGEGTDSPARTPPIAPR